MRPTLRQFKQIFVIVTLLVTAGIARAQTQPLNQSRQLKSFIKATTEAGITFNLPEGFKELNNRLPDDNEMDYGMAPVGSDFEIWFAVRSYKKLARHYRGMADSAYLSLAKDQISNFSADNDYFVRNLSPRILNQYQADEGKSYLVNLNDSAETRHYRYALIIVLQKNRTGAITAVCLTNDKGAEFFKAIDKARGCIKFKS
ncbi:hypothetical protein [Mucilaginibacter ginkgonis]|uniref:Uncharacterized protein n=1 Tax=Mucilaginibacter ginkgonis TaxID=2682091 RepID=A0A6I4I208_9SPHI|nr:hypothetical protein [Mucilaginibacter ginkgonis]QQL49330.1 hypothetical protein GO620_014300 [Mucilaginibacter ginkgonis]